MLGLSAMAWGDGSLGVQGHSQEGLSLAPSAHATWLAEHCHQCSLRNLNVSCDGNTAREVLEQSPSVAGKAWGSPNPVIWMCMSHSDSHCIQGKKVREGLFKTRTARSTKPG